MAPPSSAALIRVLFPSLPRSRYVVDLRRDAVRHRRTVGLAGVELGPVYDFAVRRYGLVVEEELAAPPSSAALIRILYPSLPRSRYVADLTRDAVRHRRTVGPAGVKLGTAYDFPVRQYGLMVEKELSEDAVPVGRPSRRHPV